MGETLNRQREKAMFARINSPNSRLGKLAINLLKKQPKHVQNSIRQIIISDKILPREGVADYNTSTGVLRIKKNKKFNRAFDEPILKHEFAHADFDYRLQSGDPKVKQYVDKALDIKPPTINMLDYNDELKKAKASKKPELRGTYADELHSETAEHLALKKFGNDYITVNPKEMQKAVKLYQRLHAQ